MRSHYSAATPTWSSLEGAQLLALSASQLMKNRRLQEVQKESSYFEISKTFHYLGVRIKLVGEARVRWSERQTHGTGDNRERKTIRYKNQARFMIWQEMPNKWANTVMKVEHIQ